jgi:4'-phosphopantetheinyl transferase
MNAPHAVPLLGERDVHVWTANLAVPAARIASLAELLSPDERLRVARFAAPAPRERFVAARGQLRELLSSYVGLSPTALRFDYSAEGKPSLAVAAAPAGIHFNLSHSDDVVVYAISRVDRVGIDVERVRQFPGMHRIAERFLSTAERQEIATMAPGAFLLAFHCGWTRKEAYLKALGCGLLAPLGDFDVSVSPLCNSALLHIRGDDGDVARWSLTHFAPDDGYVGAVAVEHPAPALSYHEWE